MGGDGLELAWSPEGDRAALFEALATTEALLHVLEPITAEVMDAAPRLRFIQKLGVGVNTIDLDAARVRGVMVANMPGANAAAVAEMTVGLLLAVLRRVPAVRSRDPRRVGAGRWIPAVPDGLGEVGGRTVGLVGYGDIARRVAAIVTAMGATVVHHQRTTSAPGWLPLDELLGTADVVSLHVPLTDETRLLLDAPSHRSAQAHGGARQHQPGRGARPGRAHRGADGTGAWPVPASTCSPPSPSTRPTRCWPSRTWS